MFRKIFGTSAALLGLVLLPFSVSAAVIGSVTINPSVANQGQTILVSGSCGSGAGNMTASIGLNNPPSAQNTNVITNASGNFSANITVPMAFTTGASSVVATCPNGDTLTGSFTVNSPIGNSLSLSTNTPTLGQPLTVSSSCGTISTGSNVLVSLVRSFGTPTNLGTVSTITANGDFSGTFTIPQNAGGGPVSIVATCPNGTITTNSGITDPNANVSVGNARPTVGGSFPVSAFCNTAAGGIVDFMLSNPFMQADLGTAVTGVNGGINTTLTVPAGFVTGNATLVMFCPTGNLVTAGLVVDPGTGTIVPPPTDTAAGSTTPTGGVAAGNRLDLITLAAFLLVSIGAVSFMLSKQSKKYVESAHN